jgi:hypothetical protein
MSRPDLSGPAALVLDELLTHPDAVHIAAQLRELRPVGLRDQFAAAARHVQAGVDTVIASGVGGMNGRHMPARDTPGWLRLGVLTALSTWFADTASTCVHSPHPSRPQPVAAAAWKPGQIVCGRCTHLLRLANTDADRTCDGCGHLTAGPAHDDGIWPGVVVLGGDHGLAPRRRAIPPRRRRREPPRCLPPHPGRALPDVGDHGEQRRRPRTVGTAHLTPPSPTGTSRHRSCKARRARAPHPPTERRSSRDRSRPHPAPRGPPRPAPPPVSRRHP